MVQITTYHHAILVRCGHGRDLVRELPNHQCVPSDLVMEGLDEWARTVENPDAVLFHR